MKKFHIALSGLMNSDTPSAAVGLALSLKSNSRFTVRLTGVVEDHKESGAFYPGLWDALINAPNPDDDAGSWAEAILQAHEKDRFQLFLPGRKNEITAAVSAKADFRSRGLRVRLPSKDQLPLFFQEFFRNLAMEERLPLVPGQLLKPLDTLDLKIFSSAKAIYLETAEGRRYKVSMRQDVEALRAKFASQDFLFFYQEPEGFKGSALILPDEKGAFLKSFSVRHIIENDYGIPWMGITFRDPSLEAILQKLCEALSCPAPFTVNFFSTQSDGYLLKNIEPGFPSWSGIWSQMGYNPAAEWILSAVQGKSANHESRGDYPLGIVFSHYAVDDLLDHKNFKDISG